MTVLRDLEESGEIQRLRATRKELLKLLESARRKLEDASSGTISRESRLGLAYQCILTLAKLVLRAQGYRLKGRRDEHVRTINTLRRTLGTSEERIKYYHSLRIKRHRDLYEGGLAVSSTELNEALERGRELLAEAEKWLTSRYPQFLGG